MYLSRLILDQRSRAVRRDLADCHGMHRTLLRVFFAGTDREGGARGDFGLLYRVEFDRRSGMFKVYVQSREQPDWTQLPPGYLAEDGGTENPACKQIEPAYARLRSGMVLSFALRANPTRKVSTPIKKARLAGEKGNGHRAFLAKTDEQINWLRRKGAEGGYELLGVRIDTAVPDLDARHEPDVKGHKGRGEDRTILTFGSVLFQGHLRITDADKLRATLVKGIGSGKAYGFGLLSVAPPR